MLKPQAEANLLNPMLPIVYSYKGCFISNQMGSKWKFLHNTHLFPSSIIGSHQFNNFRILLHTKKCYLTHDEISFTSTPIYLLFKQKPIFQALGYPFSTIITIEDAFYPTRKLAREISRICRFIFK